MISEHAHLNDGFGEGVSYRGRLLIALKTSIIDSDNIIQCTVEAEQCLPLAEVRDTVLAVSILAGKFCKCEYYITINYILLLSGVLNLAIKWKADGR